MSSFDIRAGWTKRKPLLTRAQLERLNGCALPRLTIPSTTTVWKPRSVGPTLSVVERLEGAYGGQRPTLFLPVSDRERRHWEIGERLRRKRLALLEGAF